MNPYNKDKKTVPYSDEAYGTIPTPWTRFVRKCIIWQLWRFFRLNLKMMRIVVGGHS